MCCSTAIYGDKNFSKIFRSSGGFCLKIAIFAIFAHFEGVLGATKIAIF